MKIFISIPSSWIYLLSRILKTIKPKVRDVASNLFKEVVIAASFTTAPRTAFTASFPAPAVFVVALILSASTSFATLDLLDLFRKGRQLFNSR